ncbi:MAG: nitroreductase family protein [Planctomycetota bacterium]
MDVMEAIQKRRSVRNYEDRPVEEETLQAVLEAGRLAPSARNLQEWRYVVVRDPELRAKLVDAANGQKFVGQAPVVLVACAKTDGHKMACGEPSYPIDVAISLDHMSLKAVEEGLGTCWVGAFDPAAVKKLLGIPDAIRVVELMPLGYPAGEASPRSRLDLEEVVSFDKWGWR